MITYIFYGLFVLSCVILILSILLQPGKADAGALFSSSVSSTAFGPRGTQTLLSKITIGAAASFMIIGLCLSLPFVSGTSSVLQAGESPQTPAATPTPAPTPQPAQSAPAAVPTSTVLTPSPAPTKKK
ncbi:MAG: preprotein translocase subunit SecG [Acidobacteria bacterium]|nr:MAG: preprotein translocase subunit SecG [Acidobacteriota bacterium]